MSLGAGARTMATRAPKEFLCIMPDKPNVLQVRKQVKSQHYEGIKPLIESGRLVSGEDVKAIIENDVYATSGIWDLERMQIIPYVAAVRQPLSS
ncbi:hypothetical protein CGCS363_v001297 [Colletotrichum siamense]|uniref:uncharacterized protein n=1 Tax=Colletotrichum siamense TaxID=690259 RepID=UPI001872F0A8|nr:uncharacterized protein CGCS363_v001297 [Colletotrichum siamense]KAF5516863.1 hypothetical protein CGCS363_v001297 [Colletotrichum siamense]